MSVLTDLPRMLKAEIRRHKVPGATLAVYRNGRVTEAAAGVINVDTAVSTTTDSVFQIGSISKLFTGTLIMQLVDEGLVDLDAPIRSYLPEFTVLDGEASRTVTVRQLLCHSSGIEGDYFVNSGRGDESVARLQDMGSLLPQLFPPGERMSYCNFGYAMLGRIIEVLTRESFDVAISKRIFGPLGMTHSLTLPEETVRFRTAIGHVPHPKKKGVNVQSPMPWLSIGQKAAGATPSMSVGDLMKFVDMHLRRGRSRDGKRILSARSVAAMQRRQIRLPRNAPRAAVGWGLSWILCNWSNSRVIGHDGGTVGQYSFLRILPKKKLAVALLTNGGDALCLYEAIFEQTFEKLGRVAQPSPPEPKPGLDVDPGRLVGVYENLSGQMEISYKRKRFKAEMRAREGMLTGQDLKPFTLEFADRNTAIVDAPDAPLHGQAILFDGNDLARPDYVNLGFRLFRRR